ncbi:MAG: hypothetical protein ACP5LM_04405 [Thermoplasmata archaeon]
MYTVIDFAISINDDGTYDFMTYGEIRHLKNFEDIKGNIMSLGEYFETEESYDDKMEELVKVWLDSKKKGGYIVRLWRYKGGYSDYIYSFHIVGQGIDWMSPPVGSMEKLSDFVLKFIKITEDVIRRIRDETGKGLEIKENMNRANVMIFLSLKGEGLI